MIAIISRQDENGDIPVIGMSHRILVKRYKTIKGIEKFAREFAQGKKYRIELFKDNGIYSEPFTIIHKS